MEIDQKQSYEEWINNATKQLGLPAPLDYIAPINYINKYNKSPEFTMLDKSPTKLITIDYMNNLEVNKYNYLLNRMLLKEMSSMMGIPKQYTTSTDPHKKINRWSILEKYPMVFTNYTEHEQKPFVGEEMDIPNWPKLRDKIDKFVSDCIPVFKAQTRDVRDADGNICDPWGRAIPHYLNKFVISPIHRKEIEVTADFTGEIIAWIVETSVDGEKVVIVLWEKVKLAHTRQSGKDFIIDSLYPNKCFKNPSYTNITITVP